MSAPESWSASFSSPWANAGANLHFLQCVAGLLLINAEFCRPGTVLFASLGGLLFVTGAYWLAAHPLALAPLLMLILSAATTAFASWGRLPKWTLIPAGLTLLWAAVNLAPGQISPLVGLAGGALWLTVTAWLLGLASLALKNKWNVE